MADDEIRKLCRQLEKSYPDGGYVSRATLFNRALNEGKITEATRDEAQKYYRNLWTYVGDRYTIRDIFSFLYRIIKEVCYGQN